MIRKSANPYDTDREDARKPIATDMTRRGFLHRGVAVAGLVGGSMVAAGPSTSVALSGLPEGSAQASELKILGAVQDHLLPSAPGTPGAGDVGAVQYLAWVLADPDFDADIKRFIIAGAQRLEEDSQAETNQGFVSLSHTGQAQMLEATARRRTGERWMSTLLTYTLEALLCDPVYAGNPDGVGWKWLEHRPGFPRPPVSKRYGNL